MKVQRSENKLVITEEFIFDQNKLQSDPNNHLNGNLSSAYFTRKTGLIKAVLYLDKASKDQRKKTRS